MARIQIRIPDPYLGEPKESYQKWEKNEDLDVFFWITVLKDSLGDIDRAKAAFIQDNI